MLKLIINNDEPVLDTDLAVALGMKNTRFIRNDLIKANMEELRTYGNLMATPSNPGKRGRPALVYHLNKDQALLLCMSSRDLFLKNSACPFRTDPKPKKPPVHRGCPCAPSYTGRQGRQAALLDSKRVSSGALRAK